MRLEKIDFVSVFDLEALDLRDDVLQLLDAFGPVVVHIRVLVGLGLEVFLLRLSRKGAGSVLLHRLDPWRWLPVGLLRALLPLRIPLGVQRLRRVDMDWLLRVMMALPRFDFFRIVARFPFSRIDVLNFRELDSFLFVSMGDARRRRFLFWLL